jgi:hypothetical protein
VEATRGRPIAAASPPWPGVARESLIRERRGAATYSLRKPRFISAANTAAGGFAS